MGYVKSWEEIQQYERFFQRVVSRRESLNLTFRTTQEFARHVLPPCFDVPADATCTAYVGSSREFFEGKPIRVEEETGGVSIQAIYQGVPGSYSLTCIRSGDMHITTGRELWGVPKKRGEARLFDEGVLMYGYCERGGKRLIEIEADMHVVEPVQRAHNPGYFIKAWIDASGRGLQHDPVLVTLDREEKVNSLRRGDPREAFFKLSGTPQDPVDTIPIGEILDVSYRTIVSAGFCKSQVTLTDRALYEPYIWGVNWDDLTDQSIVGRK